ncbi:MAG TPA: hypothetical protein PLI45_01215 [Candidatus Woesebacteria bacterium]|nr:hypothetical protein [Candidatus Woesebacteria bacterium]
MIVSDNDNLDTIEALSDKKDAVVGLSWRGNNYKIGKASWSMKGLFVFRSEFHGKSEIPMIWGKASLKDHKFKLYEGQQSGDRNDLHITLHPPDGDMGGKMHVRSSNKEILPENKRSIDWYPVISPFNLFHLYTPPLDVLTTTTEKINFLVPIPDHCTSSVVMRVDILPPSNKFQAPPASLVAFTPHFIAELMFTVVPDRLQATLLWPSGSDLSL